MNPKEMSLREIIKDSNMYWASQELNRKCGEMSYEELTSAIEAHYKAKQLSKREIEKIIQPYWFLAVFIPFLGITWLIEKITNTIFKAQEEKDK